LLKKKLIGYACDIVIYFNIDREKILYFKNKMHYKNFSEFCSNIRGLFEKKQDCANNYFITNENSKLQHVPF